MEEAVNHGLDDRLFSHIVESNLAAPYYRSTGIRTRALAPGAAEMVVHVDTMHTNPLGRVHGGLIASLADAAMGNAVRSLGYLGVTVDCTVSFMNAPQPGVDLIGKGRVIKAGHNVLFVEAEIWAGDTLVARSTGSFFNTGRIDLG